MLNYLLDYGVKSHTINYEELDINDRLMLQDQINKVRKNYYELLNLLDVVQDKYLECTKNMSKRAKELIASDGGSRTNSLLSSDEKYVTLEAESSALKTAMTMINGQIDFAKSDLRILNSVFYNKF